MYGEVVDGVDGHRFEQALTDLKAARGVEAGRRARRGRPRRADRDLQADLRARRPAGRSRRTRARSSSAPSAPSSTPGTRRARRSTGAPTRSRTTSARPSTSSRWSSATRATRSGTGVCFTRDPSTGESRLYGEFLQNAQGEDVVAGIRTPEPIERMGELLPEAYAQLLETIAPARGALPRHAGHRVHGRGRARSTSSRRARRSGRPRRRCGRRSRWSTRG